MDIAAKIKLRLPTIFAYLEKRRKAKQNQLPKHLRPPVIWPIWIQIALNSGLLVTLCNLIIDRDDYLSEAGPAIILVICFLLLIFTLIEAVRYRRFYDKIRGKRLAKINFFLMIAAFLTWAACIVMFLP
jgi:hypothetical protein